MGHMSTRQAPTWSRVSINEHIAWQAENGELIREIVYDETVRGGNKGERAEREYAEGSEQRTAEV